MMVRVGRVAIAGLWAACLFGQPAPVTIAQGRITGKDLNDELAWLGIPYAAPPVGELRWKPPQPPARWTGVRAMEEYGHSCMQPKLLTAAVLPPQSEDCLMLNVWAPKRAQKAAVMFWIHGGAFVEGSGAVAAYAGTSLARQGVVVVTINYRLGDFGLFAYPELSKEAGKEPAGNFAFMDQIAALQWVRENIAAFGGDPENVTIFGESAGGSAVNFLMASPPARGLFQRAIAESGGGQSRARTLADLERASVSKAQQWGAAGLKALRAMPAKDILNKMGPRTLAEYAPVVDGKYVLEAPGAAFASGRQAPVEFLLGANSFEACLMAPFRLSADQVLAQAGTDRDKLRELYGSNTETAAREFFTDAVFLGPARYLAAQMESVRRPAYLYFFSYVFRDRRGQAQGAAHGTEIPFVFDQFPGALRLFATAEDRQMADTVSGYWVQFAKTGNPNRAGLPDWPAYVASTDRLLELGAPIEVRTHFRQERLNLLDAAAGRKAK